MYDMNGKPIHIGTEVHTMSHGLCRIFAIEEENNPDKGGALIRVFECKANGETHTLRTDEHRVQRVRTWKELATEAISNHVQNASNLGAILRSMAEVYDEVRNRQAADGSKDDSRQHPICQLWADKVASLTGTQVLGQDDVSKAYDWAYKLLGQ